MDRDPPFPVGALRWPSVFADLRNLLIRLRIYAWSLAKKYPPQSFGILVSDVKTAEFNSIMFHKVPSQPQKGIPQSFIDNISFVKSGSQTDLFLYYVDRCIVMERLLDTSISHEDYLSSFPDLVEIPTQVMNNLDGNEGEISQVLRNELSEWAPQILTLAAEEEDDFFVEQIRSCMYKTRYFSDALIAQKHWCYGDNSAKPNVLIRMTCGDELVGFMFGICTSYSSSPFRNYPSISLLWKSSEILLYIHFFYVKKSYRKKNVGGSLVYEIVRQIHARSDKPV